MAVIVLYLGGVALVEQSTYWLAVALPFVAEPTVMFGARALPPSLAVSASAIPEQVENATAFGFDA